MIKDGATILFQGDSITDAGRSRENDAELGSGYAMFVASWLSAAHPQKRLRFLNRGISGNRVRDLKARWQEDCLDLKPDFLTIMIGINDTWRRYDRNDPTSAEKFEEDYRFILSQTREHTQAEIILLEPFVLPHPQDRISWREDLDPKIHVVRKLAREFKTRLIPTDGLFASAAAFREPEFWAPDGVHPSPAGHALIARAVIKELEA
ncbi:MAG: SGNH/GDSL hydrolase family protein [Firmicutes bacterium]|jgi:lysophospholipase L1-like esterase|nr:SGNH/GDSL hydrolase family protein [Bacillota bacterium]HOB21828.1 SGNH/GDSL hydrolase family protein [Bacillota bacterium]HQD40616.1 SGNH/GDSL hydrolase family protein [Bacillota bacterium]